MEHVRSTDGTPIAFARQGSGEPLLLVHGTTGAGASWALVTPHLEDRFTVVTMDRRGRGESGDGTGYSLDLEADDVAAVVDAVGGGVHVVGHSFGARIVPLAAMRTGGVRSLMLYEPPLALQHMPDGLVDRVEELVRAGDPDAAADAFLGEAGVAAPEELEFLKGFEPAWERIRAGVPTAPREIRALAARPLDLDSLRRVEVPVLILVGELTGLDVVLDGLDEFEAAFPDARRVTIPGQRHLAVGFAPEVFAELVASFVQKVDAAAERS